MSLFFVAYIDPNAGGPIVQLLVPMFVALGALWVLFKQKVVAGLKRVFGRFRRAT